MMLCAVDIAYGFNKENVCGGPRDSVFHSPHYPCVAVIGACARCDGSGCSQRSCREAVLPAESIDCGVEGKRFVVGREVIPTCIGRPFLSLGAHLDLKLGNVDVRLPGACLWSR